MSFLTKIQAAVKAVGEEFHLKGSYLLVERMEKEVSTKSGIVIATDTKHTTGMAMQSMEKVRVLAVGAGYYDPETGEDTPLDTLVGDIIYTDGGAVKILQLFPGVGSTGGKIGIMDESAMQMRFRGEEAVKRFEEAAEQAGAGSGE